MLNMQNKTRQRQTRRGLHASLPEQSSPHFDLWQQNRNASPLLRLPPEIRNRIYELLLRVGQIRVHYTPWVHKSRANFIKGGFGCRLMPRDQNPYTTSPPAQLPHGAGTRQDRIPQRGLTLLSGVCRQLYHETVLLPYQLNTWSFENDWVMERFMLKERRLSRFQRRAIHTMYVERALDPAMEKFLGGLKMLRFKDGTRWIKVADADFPGSRPKLVWKILAK